MLIVVGFFAGMFFIRVQLLQKYGYVNGVNWDKLGNDVSVIYCRFSIESSLAVKAIT